MAHREKQIIFAYEIRTFCRLQDRPTATIVPLSLILLKTVEFWFRVCLVFVLGRVVGLSKIVQTIQENSKHKLRRKDFNPLPTNALRVILSVWYLITFTVEKTYKAMYASIYHVA